jgi:restriction system protein
LDYRTIIILILIAALSALSVILLMGRIRRKREQEIVPMDDLEGHDFEFYCADLLRGNGFRDVRVTRGSGDFGVDILAEKEDVTYAVQCKCYSSPIGVYAVQEAYSGRDFYGRMVGAVMTNQYFTRSAQEAADRLKIILWDRDRLASMEEAARR